MQSNIEIKAILKDLLQAEAIAKKVADSNCHTVYQEDVFFTTNGGRLKLRILSDKYGELIFYDRPDSAEPKQSDYYIYKSGNPFRLRQVLTASLGETIVVKKKRHIYLAGQLRIHLDEVEGLGTFIELEMTLTPGEDPSQGYALLRDFMRRFAIDQKDLVSCSYADMLL